MFTPALPRSLPWLLSLLLAAPCAAAPTGRTLEAAPSSCDAARAAAPAPPAVASARLNDSRAVAGRKDIAWAWLGSPTSRYSHAALGSSLHAGSLHVLARQGRRRGLVLAWQLPPERVFEDRVPRLVDLDDDGRDEIVLVEAHAEFGAALVVLGLESAGDGAAALRERARSPWIGTPQRWLNPAGAADFDGDGRLEVAAVLTPHLGGVLTLYRYQPPRLLPLAGAPGFSNHRNGTLEQQLTTVVQRGRDRPVLLLPGLERRSLHAMTWQPGGGWVALGPPLALAASIQRIDPLPDGACVHIDGGARQRVRLRD